MSLNENSSVASNSSSDSSDSSSDSLNFSKEFDEWEERIQEENRIIDRMLEDMLINLIVGDQTRRSRRRHSNRECRIREERLMNDYFVERPAYAPEIFRCRFRMQKSVFLRIVEAVTANDEYFQRRRGARKGLSSLQKCTGAIRVLAYGASSDVVDEYLQMDETATEEALTHFVEGVISCFGDEYLRRPNERDLARLLNVAEERGFPGMVGSINCVHWEWKICPTTEQYRGKDGKPRVVLEAAASYDLWIWHAFFGTPGVRNTIDALHRSPFFGDVLEGRAPEVSYVVNGRRNDSAYYITDRTYPPWAAFVRPIIAPQIRKHKLFVQRQETIRKDVEWAFELLQARFTFLRRPCFIRDKILMGKIMIACVIMHNMIVEDERDTYQNYSDPTEFLMDVPEEVQAEDFERFRYSTERIANLSAYMTNRDQFRNRVAHCDLRDDLIEHLWEKFGSSS